MTSTRFSTTNSTTRPTLTATIWFFMSAPAPRPTSDMSVTTPKTAAIAPTWSPSGAVMLRADSHGTAIANSTARQTTAYATPAIKYVIALALTIAHRDGVASTVGVIVWYRYSVVTASTPRTNSAM